MRKELLLEVGTFLVRAWSGKDVKLQIKNVEPVVKHEQNIVVIPSMDYFAGDDFMQYRQWRVTCWSAAMRLKHSSKFLQNDLAYGHILNTLEQKRVESIGIKEWPGMLNELIFNEAASWQYRPVLNSLYGIHRRVIAFSQYFITGYIKGDLDPFEMQKVEKAAKLAEDIVKEAIEKGYGTEWVEQSIPKILKVLGIDALFSIPLPFSRSKIGIKLSDEELFAMIERLLRKQSKEGIESLDILQGGRVREEFEQLKILSKITDKREQVSISRFPLEVPESKSAEMQQRDLELVNKILRSLKSWKSGWVERHDMYGDEFDVESFLHTKERPFIRDLDLRVKSKLAILLDHSSSISSSEVEYKRVFAALCKALDQLAIRFIALAFNTTREGVRCWVIKSQEERWSKVSERRLWSVQASGGTPLAEVYENIIPIIKSFKPDILLTLSDGEPNDPAFTKEAVYNMKRMGIKMISFGIGEDTSRALEITRNLKKLGYDRCIAVSRLNEIPKKVLALLAGR